MKWLKLLSFLIYLFFNSSIFGQVSSLYIPLQEYNLTDKVIKVRFIFLAKVSPYYPHNFTATSNGNAGGPYANGDQYAAAVIAKANAFLSSNQPPNLWTATVPPAAKYQFALVMPSLYFQSDSYCYDDADPTCIYRSLDVNDFIPADEQKNYINVFLFTRPDPIIGGEALCLGCSEINAYKCAGYWEDYKSSVLQNNVSWHIHRTALHFLHETGHILGLPHTICNCGSGNCSEPSASVNMCDDIPTIAEMGYTTGQLCPSDGQSPAYRANNIMNSLRSESVFSMTACQLGLVHYRLCTEQLSLWLNPPSFPVTTTVTSSTTNINKPYPVYGENVVTSGNVVLQTNKPTVFVYSNKVTLNSGFRAQRGSAFQTYKIDKSITNKSTREEKKNIPDSYNLFSIYPNPGDDKINFFVSEPGSIKIYSATGQLVYRNMQVSEAISVDMSNQKPGIYIVNFQSESTSVSKKLIIEH